MILRTVEQSLGSRRMLPIFTRCVRIVLSGLISTWLPCYWLVVVLKCRFTRLLVCGDVLLKDKLLDQLNLIIQNFKNVHRPVQYIRFQ